MGEVGIKRDEFLYILKWWEILAIIDGYRKRERTFMLMTRWSTFMTMSTGMADLKKAGIRSPEDLITFSWEREEIAKRGFSAEEMAEIDKIIGTKKAP